MKLRKSYLWVNQYGSKYYAASASELQKKLGGRKSKMYIDTRDGGTLHVGYVIGGNWLTRYDVCPIGEKK